MENTKTGFGARLAGAGKSALNSYGSVLIAIVALSVVWAIASPFFLTAANLKNIGVYMSASGIIAAGVTVSMLLGGLDLSQMSIMAFSGMVVGVSYKAGVGGPVLMLIAMAVGVLCGVLNGLVMNYMRISPIITTLGTSMVFRAMAYIVSNGNMIHINDNFIKWIGRGKLLGIPTMIVIAAAVYIIIGIVRQRRGGLPLRYQCQEDPCHCVYDFRRLCRSCHHALHCPGLRCSPQPGHRR